MTFWRGQNAKDRKQIWSWGGGRGVDSRGAYEEVMEMCISQVDVQQDSQNCTLKRMCITVYKLYLNFLNKKRNNNKKE